MFATAVARANFKLSKNHERLKEFAENDLTQTTFINGPQGTGKTLLNVSLSLVSEENYIEELEKKLLDYELQYKYLNFASVRKNPEQFPEHKEYFDIYDKLTNRKSYLISNYTIHSPYFDDNSKSWDFEYMKKNINYPDKLHPLEEYILTARVEYLLEHGINPENIVCFTFTNKAAYIMKYRLRDSFNINALYNQYNSFLNKAIEKEKCYRNKNYVPLPNTGSEPYLFISYSHKDSDIIYPILSQLQLKRCRIWLDEGINGGQNWRKMIASKIESSNCKNFIIFISENSISSFDVKAEINAALDLKKEIIPIYLDGSRFATDISMYLYELHRLQYDDNLIDNIMLSLDKNIISM